MTIRDFYTRIEMVNPLNSFQYRNFPPLSDAFFLFFFFFSKSREWSMVKNQENEKFLFFFWFNKFKLLENGLNQKKKRNEKQKKIWLFVRWRLRVKIGKCESNIWPNEMNKRFEVQSKYNFGPKAGI